MSYPGDPKIHLAEQILAGVVIVAAAAGFVYVIATTCGPAIKWTWKWWRARRAARNV